MSQDHFNGLASLDTHKDIKIHVQEVIETFARKCKKRLSLINLLKSDHDLDSCDEAIHCANCRISTFVFSCIEELYSDLIIVLSELASCHLQP